MTLPFLWPASTSRWGLGRRGGDWIPGVERCYIDDVFGNRIELIADVAGRPR